MTDHIVYAGRYNDYDQDGHKTPRKFTFLGYDFKPRGYKGKTVYTPAMGVGALLMIRQKLQKLGILSMTHKTVQELADRINPVCRGWINYYGHSRRSSLYKLATLMDKRIAKYLKKKHKMLHGQAWKMLRTIKKKSPNLFVHWYLIASNPQRAVCGKTTSTVVCPEKLVCSVGDRPTRLKVRDL
ncbi:group II intron maturase-specific domain-containing protein [Rickettsia endosymbiont of Orchestes rusci]|uniref:group II intron maturase-specific domain-containing protein n=1 Tax=Rickettsia endosymbiont of Orchestes rusci TaxID=3066250 RepID=UPI00313ED1D6